MLAFSVVASAGSMPCLLGLPMEPVKPVVATESMSPDHGCCKPKAEAPKPVEQKNKCCCIDTLTKNAVDFGVAKAVDFRIDFAILSSPVVRLELLEPIFAVEQIRWPEVHGPPGITLSQDSPRAPPMA
ncbi:MAG: hypothetical protein H7Y17_07690 [Chlorobia bacterium]|nr:hypothetical protein [Fimbriimonadaceae bacterium]